MYFIYFKYVCMYICSVQEVRCMLIDMSPLCQVSSLQMCCLHLALNEIHQGLSNGHKKSLHKFLVTTLHGGIRQQLIDLAVNKYR